jgi:lysine 2,3-aminomutase
MGKQVCLHTHINHAKEITWVTELAARKLYKYGVIVRNQSVLLKGVNDSAEALLDLITKLANINIQPYYVYQCDMVKGVEDLRTPLKDIIKLDKELRGQLSGFMMPSFVIDLPGGGGKRLVSTHESYKDGKATYKAPGLPGAKGKRVYTYYDPKPVMETVLEAFRDDQRQALQRGETLAQFFAQSPPMSNPASRRRSEPVRRETTLPSPHPGTWEPSEEFAYARAG